MVYLITYFCSAIFAMTFWLVDVEIVVQSHESLCGCKRLRCAQLWLAYRLELL